ncbi:MAG: AMP-binding protein [Pseudomonadales bacterium]|nr:AMP-binding protein [Pseudomonadales bacterium]
MKTALIKPDKIFSILQYWQQHSPNKNALWWQGQYITYQTLYQQVLQMVSSFKRALNAGDRIAVLAYNSPQYVALMYAIPAADNVFVPVNARLSAAEWIYQLKKAGVSLLIAEPELLQTLLAHDDFKSQLASSLTLLPIGHELDIWLQEHSGCLANSEMLCGNDQSLAWLLYTSGSTGKPKAAMLTQASLLAAVESAAYGRPVLEDDHYLYPFPLFHVSAHNILLQHRFGACVVLLSAFDAQLVIQCCRELTIDTMSLAPTMIAMLLDHPNFNFSDLSQVRTIGYGASAIPAALLQRLLKNSNVGLCQGYGMTELSGSIAFLTPADHQQALKNQPQRLKSVGKVVPGVQVKIGDDGEIQVKAPQAMLGYWPQEDDNNNGFAEGWFCTGDIGYFDDDGYLYVVDRKKDMIITGGENVASQEVEDVLTLHGDIQQAAVVACADKHWGEAVTAFIQLNTGVSANADEIKLFCRDFLAAYKVPKTIYFLAHLPLNASGKINKPALRQEAKKRVLRG